MPEGKGERAAREFAEEFGGEMDALKAENVSLRRGIELRDQTIAALRKYVDTLVESNELHRRAQDDLRTQLDDFRSRHGADAQNEQEMWGDKGRPR